ncbi:TPA: hypothetical protein SMF66_005163, partial [Serratia marcescens]|nr:hypothetical protein [Serratia marcescens]HEJ7076191.1 hypothetical protein [Serratia marcescens]
PKIYDALAMTVREKPKRTGFAVLMKGFLGTDTYQCILCKGRLRFAGAVAGEHATNMLSDRLQRMAKKRWLQAPPPGTVRLKTGFRLKTHQNRYFYR